MTYLHGYPLYIPPKRRKPILRERNLHKAVADYLRLALPPSVFWTTFPSGSGGAARGGQLKAMGLRAGVPDIIMLFRGRFLAIELKAKRGWLSEAQQACQALITGAGGTWAEARSVEDVDRIVAAFGIPLRGRVTT